MMDSKPVQGMVATGADAFDGAFDAYLAQRVGPVARALLLTGAAGYTLFAAVGALTGVSQVPAWLRFGMILPLLAVALATLRARSARALGLLGLAVVVLLEIGIFVNGYTRPQGAAWILPAYIIVPIASSPIWLNRRDFILAMLVCCLLGPLPLLWLVRVDDWELFQYITYMAAAAVVSSVLYGHLVRLVSDHYQLEQRLRQLAFVDGLTGLASRPRFLEQARALLEASRVTGGTLAALYLDADHFKRLNDQHSHAAGDVALGIIGDTLRRHLRPGDVVGRIGGEEFAILLPGASEEIACATAERLRAAVAASRGAATALSISVGVAVRRDEATLEALLARADAALTVAKRNGRNRVERAP